VGVLQNVSPKVVHVKFRRVEVQRVGGHAAQIDQSLAYLTAADCMIRTMGFGIGLFKKTHPQLLIICAAESQSHVSGEVCSIGIGYARQLIVNHDAAPLTVEEESQDVAAAGRRGSVDEEASD
jgi:hypothetical protein